MDRDKNSFLVGISSAVRNVGGRDLLLAHYSLSFVGVAFETCFTHLEIFVIGAVCMWCALYAISLLARFLVTLAVWLRRDRYGPMGASAGR